jgi:membrane protein implicated in regulation of membrane protease activity
VCGAVSLFAALIYLFASGIEQLGWPAWLRIATFVIISGIFAWLLKRISDTVSARSQEWFPRENDES